MMKNRTIITICVIVFLLLAVIVKNYSCSSAPKLKAWSKSADGIEIKSKNTALKLIKKDDKWVINEHEYLGDGELIENLEKKVRDIKLLDLVSEKDFYDKYDLTDENCVTVIVMNSGKLLRKVAIGKAGSSNNHSFVRIDDKKGIYLASGISKSDFELSVAYLRDKKIFDVQSSDIKSFSISYAGKNFVFQLNPDRVTIDESENIDGSGDDTGKAKNDSPKWICKGYEKIKLNDSSIDSLLAVFSPLRASEFPEKIVKENLKNKLCTVNIESDDRKIELTVYDQKDKGMNLAVSSESDYIFTIGNWQLNRLSIKDLNGLSVKK